jgi:hypothetical protein
VSYVWSTYVEVWQGMGLITEFLLDRDGIMSTQLRVLLR